MTNKQHITNALWGLFIADALAMPAHWFYDTENIPKAFNGPVKKYEDPPHPHPEAFMIGAKYRPDVERAKILGRKYDILHGHVKYYDTTYNRFEANWDQNKGAHGNKVATTDERYHYHHGLKAGDNTLNARLVRVLMRSVTNNGHYDPQVFLDDFVEYMTTPGLNPDPYTEVYLRRWFENYSTGLPPTDCAEFQRNNWSVSSHSGVVPGLVLSLLANSAYKGTGFALRHQNLTHRAENVSAALSVLVPLIFDLMKHQQPAAALFDKHAHAIRLPKISGNELFRMYRDHNGPANIPAGKMWQIHTTFRDEAWDLEAFTEKYDEGTIYRRILATACYPEHGVPLLMALARKHDFDLRESLLANVNAGGDNVHRGMIMGLLLGAMNREVPKDLIEGLTANQELAGEIDAFAELAVSGEGL